MASNKAARESEAFLFSDFPIDDLVIKPPSHVVPGLFGIPDIQGLRQAFINLSPNKGEWLRVCFDVDVDHISTLKDSTGAPRAFKLVVDVAGEQEAFMNELSKNLHKLFLEELHRRGEPIPKVEWHPVVMEKKGMASSFSVKVNLREHAEDLGSGCNDEDACWEGMGLYQECQLGPCQYQTRVCPRSGLAQRRKGWGSP